MAYYPRGGGGYGGGNWRPPQQQWRQPYQPPPQIVIFALQAPPLGEPQLYGALNWYQIGSTFNIGGRVFEVIGNQPFPSQIPGQFINGSILVEQVIQYQQQPQQPPPHQPMAAPQHRPQQFPAAPPQHPPQQFPTAAPQPRPQQVPAAAPQPRPQQVPAEAPQHPIHVNPEYPNFTIPSPEIQQPQEAPAPQQAVQVGNARFHEIKKGFQQSHFNLKNVIQIPITGNVQIENLRTANSAALMNAIHDSNVNALKSNIGRHQPTGFLLNVRVGQNDNYFGVAFDRPLNVYKFASRGLGHNSLLPDKHRVLLVAADGSVTTQAEPNFKPNITQRVLMVAQAGYLVFFAPNQSYLLLENQMLVFADHNSVVLYRRVYDTKRDIRSELFMRLDYIRAHNMGPVQGWAVDGMVIHEGVCQRDTAADSTYTITGDGNSIVDVTSIQMMSTKETASPEVSLTEEADQTGAEVPGAVGGAADISAESMAAGGAVGGGGPTLSSQMGDMHLTDEPEVRRSMSPSSSRRQSYASDGSFQFAQTDTSSQQSRARYGSAGSAQFSLPSGGGYGTDGGSRRDSGSGRDGGSGATARYGRGGGGQHRAPGVTIADFIGTQNQQKKKKTRSKGRGKPGDSSGQ